MDLDIFTFGKSQPFKHESSSNPLRKRGQVKSHQKALWKHYYFIRLFNILKIGLGFFSNAWPQKHRNICTILGKDTWERAAANIAKHWDASCSFGNSTLQQLKKISQLNILLIWHWYLDRGHIDFYHLSCISNVHLSSFFFNSESSYQSLTMRTIGKFGMTHGDILTSNLK